MDRAPEIVNGTVRWLFWSMSQIRGLRVSSYCTAIRAPLLHFGTRMRDQETAKGASPEYFSDAADKDETTRRMAMIGRKASIARVWIPELGCRSQRPRRLC